MIGAKAKGTRHPVWRTQDRGTVDTPWRSRTKRTEHPPWRDRAGLQGTMKVGRAWGTETLSVRDRTGDKRPSMEERGQEGQGILHRDGAGQDKEGTVRGAKQDRGHSTEREEQKAEHPPWSGGAGGQGTLGVGRYGQQET